MKVGEIVEKKKAGLKASKKVQILRHWPVEHGSV